MSDTSVSVARMQPGLRCPECGYGVLVVRARDANCPTCFPRVSMEPCDLIPRRIAKQPDGLMCPKCGSVAQPSLTEPSGPASLCRFCGEGKIEPCRLIPERVMEQVYDRARAGLPMPVALCESLAALEKRS